MRSLTIIVTLAVCGLAIAACGGGSSDSTPTPAPTPTPVQSSGSWTAQLTGAVTGNVTQNAPSTCQETDGSYHISLQGPVDTAGGNVSITLGSFATGSFDYAKASSGLAMGIKYTPASGTAQNFVANAGAPGASGTVTVSATGGGNMRVTVPPSTGTAALSIDATWNCS